MEIGSWNKVRPFWDPKLSERECCSLRKWEDRAVDIAAPDAEVVWLGRLHDVVDHLAGLLDDALESDLGVVAVNEAK